MNRGYVSKKKDTLNRVGILGYFKQGMHFTRLENVVWLAARHTRYYLIKYNLQVWTLEQVTTPVMVHTAHNIQTVFRPCSSWEKIISTWSLLMEVVLNKQQAMQCEIMEQRNNIITRPKFSNEIWYGKAWWSRISIHAVHA
jgi:hypothetical protein